MVVCKYFLQGNCRFGDKCRNEHPRSGGFTNQNRFGALQNNGSTQKQQSYALNLNDIRNETTDGKGRPKWLLSSYGAARDVPASLLDGLEYSPEELRVRFFELASNGKENEADQEAIALWNKADQAFREISNNVDSVSKFMEEAEKKHPNRYDYCTMDGKSTREEVTKEAEAQNSSTSTSAFGTGFGQNTAANNPFSKPPSSNFGQPSGPSAFGSSAFGKPAFGQSGFGGNAGTNATFGQPSTASTAFGQPTPSSAFGQSTAPSAFGKPAFGSAGFGQPAFGSTTQTSSTFGQSSQPSSGFGQPSFGSSGFGQPKTNSFAPASAAGGFGQPSQPTSGFGQSNQPTSAFGQSSQTTSAFGQTTQPGGFGSIGFGKPDQSSSPFGQTPQQNTGFGQSTQPSQPMTTAFSDTTTPSAFGGASTTGFGSTSALSSPFGQKQTSTASPFGAQVSSNEPNDQSMDTAVANLMSPNIGQTQQLPFGRPANTTTDIGGATRIGSTQAGPSSTTTAQVNTNSTSDPHPLTGRPPRPVTYTQTLPAVPNSTDMSKKLTSYRGKRVQYLDGTPCYERPNGQGWEKIWFPDGGLTLDVVALNREDKVDDLQAYDDQYNDEVKEAYSYFVDQGHFKNGKLPLVPPLRSWCVYDF